MAYKLRIRPEAEVDIQEAFNYYEKCRQGLGVDFILCIEDSLEKVSKKPKHYPEVHKNIRRILVKRYPFGVFFVLKEDTIVVLAVMHGSRNPKWWKGRS